MAKKLDMNVEWIPDEQTSSGHNPSVELFARLLYPEVYRLHEEAADVLRIADRLLDEPVDIRKTEVLRRKSELEAELADLNAELEEDANGFRY